MTGLRSLLNQRRGRAHEPPQRPPRQRRRRRHHGARERRPPRHGARALHRRPGVPHRARAARPPGAGATRPRAHHPPRPERGVRRARRGARADAPGRARRQRRRHQARRAAVPRRGPVPRPLRLLGARRDPGSRPEGGNQGRGRLRAAARDHDRRRGDRRRELPGPAAGDGARRRGRRPGPGQPRLRGRDRLRGAGALLPRDALRPGDGRRERPGVRAVQHPAPDRDPGDHRPRPRPAEQPGHRAVPAHGRRVRRQGDAAARTRGRRRAGGHAHRSPGPAAADPSAGHDDDRQAARLPRDVAGRLRRRRPVHRARGHADLRRRLEPRPLRTRAVTGALPHRQRLLHPRHPGAGSHREDQQDLADRVPRLRRAAGHARGRGHHRSLRAAARDRARPGPPPQLLRRGRDDAVRAARAAPRADGARVGPGPRHAASSYAGSARSRRTTRSTRTPSGAWRSRP